MYILGKNYAPFKPYVLMIILVPAYGRQVEIKLTDQDDKPIITFVLAAI